MEWLQDPLVGVIGKWLLSAAFISSLGAMAAAWIASRQDVRTGDGSGPASGLASGPSHWARASAVLWSVMGAALLGASGLLIALLKTHQFQYYYVWNYTSIDLEAKYLLSAFYGGQEGSFLLWIVISTAIGFGLMRWTRAPYRWPVMAVMAFTQAFLLSMVLGWTVGDLTIGASPFRTLLEEMPDAPFLRANPGFVPVDGRGLNDLLKSPWMMIHPPILFVGFAMMTVPFAFAIASLWTRTYHEWVRPALPWTLAANVSLLTAIFLGGYWAYETLSFGGYWAWDPVENASLVPWLVGTAGIHTMIIQTRSSRAHKASLFFAIFAYILIVYETFLTRSGVLANASVHSFVDLGLYNQLLAFMVAMAALGIGMYVYRYREIPSPERESSVLSAEFMTFTGAMMLLVLGLVIILGTSSPIIGKLFYENPTPPEISFYNDWSGPLALIMGVLTVIGQLVFWRRHTWETVAGALIIPLLLTSGASIASVMIGQVRDVYSIVFIFISWFTVFGNAAVMLSLIRSDPKLVGGTLTHIGFGVLLLGIIASSKYGTFLVPPLVEDFNKRVDAGEAFDEEGFPIVNRIESFELKRNEPKLLNQRYMATYEGYSLKDVPRPGTQVYSIRFQPIDGGREFVLEPEVYPMMSSAGAGRVDWSVDPDIRTGWFSDIYLYVGGSAYVEQKNKVIAEAAEAAGSASGAGNAAGAADTTSASAENAADSTVTVQLKPTEPVQAGDYQFTFVEYAPALPEEVPPTTQVGIRAKLDILHQPTGKRYEVVPLFAVFIENGENYTYSPPLRVEEWGLEVQFSSVVPDQNAIELTVSGLDAFIDVDWVFVTAEKKPFVSAVWLGTFLLMAGFSVSIIRHWKRDRSANRAAAGGAPVVLLLIVGMAALGPVIPASAQVRQTHDPVVGTAAMTQAQPSPSVDPSLTRKAILASLVLPGLGHRIVDPVDWRRGKIHMGAEAVLAASLIRAVHREGSLQNEFETLAKLRAGVTLDGKSRRFELAMADYDDLASYNEAMLRSRYWDRLIEDTPENRWQWASAQDRKDYGELRSDADRAARQIPAMLSMMAVNRVISALSAYTRARRASSAATQSAASAAAFSNTTTSLMLRPVSTSMDGPAGVQLTATIRF